MRTTQKQPYAGYGLFVMLKNQTAAEHLSMAEAAMLTVFGGIAQGTQKFGTGKTTVCLTTKAMFTSLQIILTNLVR